MEVCPEAELIAFEDPATVCDRAFQIGQGREVAVGEWLIQNGPKVLGGLKLGGVWGQVDEPEALGHNQVRFGVSAGVVELKHDDALASRPGLARKQGQQRGKERLRDAVSVDCTDPAWVAGFEDGSGHSQGGMKCCWPRLISALTDGRCQWRAQGREAPDELSRRALEPDSLRCLACACQLRGTGVARAFAFKAQWHNPSIGFPAEGGA